MRLGAKTSDEFFNTLAQKSDKIAKLFQKNIEALTKPTTIKVMLGDTTVTEQSTFDPQRVADLYNRIINNLPNWKTQGIATTNDEDLRRIFVKLEFQAGKYVLLWHLSLQYHALLYYKPDIMVQKIQKELAEIMDSTIDKEKELAELTNDLIRQKLAAMGYDEPDEQKLFEILFNDDKLREELSAEIDRKTDFDFKTKDQRKKELFRQLDDLLIETYQTTSVLIDENRLVAGEEGCVCTFDLDHLKNKSRHAIFEPKRIPNDVKCKMSAALDEVIGVLSS
ncbi:MAG TPA: hypothetical protein VNK44_01875 [Candidatus Nitrosotenuis sp.]|nr:hypothetical protein [Candidatus Nitrosotenuis sp.]